jgi:hypothetical protein
LSTEETNQGKNEKHMATAVKDNSQMRPCPSSIQQGREQDNHLM